MPVAPLDHRKAGRATMWPFAVWLAVFYAVWLGLVLFGDHLATVVAHWPIAVAMALGSYVAGSTPMGGGAIGFPVIVLLLDEPATVGRDFSFAVQAIGMTSASVFILCRRLPLEVPMLLAGLLGILLGTPLGTLFVAPHTSDLTIKLLFGAILCSFGIIHLARIREITAYEGILPTNLKFDYVSGFVLGFLGSLTVASITGVGIDMLFYMVLVLLCHADLKIAIPTSVILMAFTSVVGIAVKLAMGSVQPGTFDQWIAAAPVVALGAPFGALIVARIGRKPTLLVVSFLCVAQFVWTLVHERAQLATWQFAATLAGVAMFLLALHGLYRWGRNMARRRPELGNYTDP